MRSALVAAIVVVLVATGLGTGYELGSANSTNTETTTLTTLSTSTLTQVSTTTATVTESTATVTEVSSGNYTWTVVVQNGTFRGPGCPPPLQVFMALRIPCLSYTPSSTWNASLLQYNGKYYYSAMQTVISEVSGVSTTYTVWFDNSTAYCVSPFLSVSELPTCPPP